MHCQCSVSFVNESTVAVKLQVGRLRYVRGGSIAACTWTGARVLRSIFSFTNIPGMIPVFAGSLNNSNVM